ncbi:MAG: DUF2946 family protein [Pseudomonadota bacterium]
MKKLLLILFMLVMPLQASWSAVAAYCQHEQDLVAKHFGHHEHKHKATLNDEDPQKTSKVHTDCGYCHVVPAASFAASSIASVIPLGAMYVTPDILILSSYIADGPRRPDRQPVA